MGAIFVLNFAYDFGLFGIWIDLVLCQFYIYKTEISFFGIGFYCTHEMKEMSLQNGFDFFWHRIPLYTRDEGNEPTERV